MVALTKPVIEKVFLRYGQVPLGTNLDAEPSLEEVEIRGSALSDALRTRLTDDDVFSLSNSYGDAEAGDPVTFDFMRITTSEGIKVEVEVFNIAILMFKDNTEETRRLFRIINAIKGEQDAGGKRD